MSAIIRPASLSDDEAEISPPVVTLPYQTSLPIFTNLAHQKCYSKACVLAFTCEIRYVLIAFTCNAEIRAHAFTTTKYFVHHKPNHA